MRKVILFMAYSLDGFVGGPKGELNWENRDDEVGGQLVPEFTSTVDTMLLGRVLYQGFHQAWPAMASNPQSPKERSSSPTGSRTRRRSCSRRPSERSNGRTRSWSQSRATTTSP